MHLISDWGRCPVIGLANMSEWWSRAEVEGSASASLIFMLIAVCPKHKLQTGTQFTDLLQLALSIPARQRSCVNLWTLWVDARYGLEHRLQEK